MSKKRRVFDIDLPEEIDTVPTPESTFQRRGPMASALVENAEALKSLKSIEEAIRNENDALAHEYVALREAGHVIIEVPIDKVKTTMLVRDRLPDADDAELAELVTSIKDVGLSNPIRVIQIPNDTYELIQGSRRLEAYRQLNDKEGQGAWQKIPALVVTTASDVGGLYRQMLDENIVRKDLSFAEMAHAAKVYAEDPETDANDLAAAVAALFRSAPYSKRSYIRSFATLMEVIGDTLSYPTNVPRALGVALARILKEDPSVVQRLRDQLQASPKRDSAEELAILRRHTEPTSERRVKADTTAKRTGSTKTTFQMKSAAGQVKCTAGQGCIEIRVDRDFTSIKRKRLEAAVSALIDELT